MLKATVERYFGIVANITLQTDNLRITIDDVHKESNTVWNDLLKGSFTAEFCKDNNYSEIFTSHKNNNGHVRIKRNDDKVTFINDNALGCSITFTLTFEECKEAFTYLANEYLAIQPGFTFEEET
jgi:hypothetical protein